MLESGILKAKVSFERDTPQPLTSLGAKNKYSGTSLEQSPKEEGQGEISKRFLHGFSESKDQTRSSSSLSHGAPLRTSPQPDLAPIRSERVSWKERRRLCLYSWLLRSRSHHSGKKLPNSIGLLLLGKDKLGPELLIFRESFTGNPFSINQCRVFLSKLAFQVFHSRRMGPHQQFSNVVPKTL
ncbi:hypothetical protein Tco_1393311 [Tanacetum coccineum]